MIGSSFAGTSRRHPLTTFYLRDESVRATFVGIGRPRHVVAARQVFDPAQSTRFTQTLENRLQNLTPE